MKRLYLFLLSILLVPFALTCSAQNYKVFILSGQSNCNGNVPNDQWPAEMNKVHTNIKCWVGETVEDLQGNPPRANVRSWQSLAPGWGYDWSLFSGPELSMAYRLSKLYPNDKIAIIKHNRPGQALYNYFRPPSSGGTTGQGYSNIVNTVKTALASIGGTYEIVGMGWIQGESDMQTGMGAEYETHLRNFIGDLRKSFNAPKMAFAIAQTIPNWGDATQGPLVRNAQQKVANEMPYVGIFDPSTDKTRFPIGVNDNHFVPPGSINLGIDLTNVLKNEIAQNSIGGLWNFNTNMEGWAPINSVSASVANGIAALTITGSDPYIHSPDNLTITASEYKYVVVGMQNQTTATTAELYWTTTTSTGYDGPKSVSFSIVPNDTKQRYYVIDLSSKPEWSGTIKQMRFDPTTASSGTVKVDVIKLVGTYAASPLAIPGTLECEDFNNGGMGSAYFDVDPANNGGAYRTLEGVDLEPSADNGGGYNIGWSATGEWQEYLVRINENGLYDINLRYTSLSNSNTLHLEIDGVLSTGILTAAATGGVQTWASLNTSLTLETGLHVLRVYMDNISGSLNLNKIICTKKVSPTTKKQVGIAYSPWHPEAVWSDAAIATNAVCAWGKPQLGYYKSNNIAVIDQHTDWLTDAGIDFVTMDWSNNCGTQNQWLEAYTAVFVDRQVWRKNNGLPYLLTAIMIGCPFDEASNTDGRMSAEVDVVKTNYIDHPTRGAVYYKHRGKPLVVVYQNGNWNYNSWDHSKFDATLTIRNMFATLVQNPNMHDPKTMRAVNGLWSWSENVHPPAYAFDGRPEFMSAHAALRTCGWMGPESYNQADAGTKNCIDTWGGAKGRRNGATLRESFAYAKTYDVDVVQVMAFNEWTGCENSHGEQRNPEYSNDIEPMQGGHGDLYLKIMKEEIYKFKGWDINNPQATNSNNWHFTSSMEGWTPVNQMTAIASNSIATATITGSDPFMHSPDNLNISATDYKYVVVSMQNQTASTTAELFWTTNTSTGYDGAKMVQFPTVANDTKQTYYIINLSANPNWNGTIKQLRLDPTTIVTSGATKIDFIKFAGTYTAAMQLIPGKIEVENFNKGGQGNAYFDNDAINSGGQYRATEGVDMELTGDAGGGYNVGWIGAGEWLEYLVDVQQSGSYSISLRAAAWVPTSARIEIDGVKAGPSFTIPVSGGVQTYANTTITASLASGKHILRIVMESNGLNVNNITFTKSVSSNVLPTVSITSPANNASFTAPADITLAANASDADGTISKVEFYSGTTLLASDVTTPYSFAWSNVAAGTYTITARAYDNLNATATSSVVTIVVNQVVTTSVITPYININDKGWVQSASAVLCAGGKVWFGPHPVVASGWSWTGPNGFTSSSRDFILNNITATQAGNYTTTYTDANGVKSTKVFTVTVNALPAANVTAGGPTTFSQGGSVTLTASSNATYSWFNGTTALAQTTSSITVNSSGNYSVVVTNSAGCTAQSAPVAVSVTNSVACTNVSSSANLWALRNAWSDQTGGSTLSNESTVLKATHRQYGQNTFWLIHTSLIQVQAGKTYTINMEAMGSSYASIVSAEAGFASSYSYDAPVLVQPAVVFPNGYSNTSYTRKSVTILANRTGSYLLSVKVNLSGQPSQAAAYYFKNITVCALASAAAPLVTGINDVLNSSNKCNF